MTPSQSPRAATQVRQLFSRLIDLFRGEARSYESQRWRVQRYDVCESADLRTLAPAAPGVSPKDKSYILCGPPAPKAL